MRKILYIILLPFLLVSCGQKKSKLNLSEGEVVKFETAYEPMLRYSGVLTHGDSTFIYTFNIKTFKCIDFLSTSGTKLFSVPLKELMEKSGDINDIYVKQPDSIYALSENTNRLFLINRAGKIKRELRLVDDTGRIVRIELSSSIFNGFMFNNVLLLNAGYYYKNNASLQEHYELNKTSPYFATLSGFTESRPKLSFHLSGFYRRFMSSDDCNIEGALYSPLDSNTIAMASWYSDTLYLLDKQFRLRRCIRVSSEFSPVRIVPQKVSGFSQDQLNNSLQTSGAIIRFFNDKSRKRYYVCTIHSSPKNNEKTERGSNRGWSLLVYDHSWNLLGELEMPPRKYMPGEMIICGQQILLKLQSGKSDFQKIDISTLHE